MDFGGNGGDLGCGIEELRSKMELLEREQRQQGEQGAAILASLREIQDRLLDFRRDVAGELTRIYDALMAK